MQKKFKSFVIKNIVFICFIIVAIFYLDKIIVHWIENLPDFETFFFSYDYKSLLCKISDIPFVIFGISPILIFISIAHFYFHKNVKKIFLVIFLSGISIELGNSVKTICKYLFSRNNVDHYLKTNDDSFLWLHDVHSISAFPSGHTIAIVSFLTIFWICYPRFKIFYSIFLLATLSVLMLLKFHFFSDILVGIYIGFSVSYILLSLFKFFAKKQYSELL